MEFGGLYVVLAQHARQNMPEVFVDLQKGQFRQAAQNYPIPLPALLIELRRATYTELTQGVQMCTANVAFHYYIYLGESFVGNENEAQTQAIINTGRKLSECFGCYTNGDFSPMVRISEALDYDHELCIIKAEYQTSFKDNSGQKQRMANLKPIVQIHT